MPFSGRSNLYVNLLFYVAQTLQKFEKISGRAHVDQLYQWGIDLMVKIKGLYIAVVTNRISLPPFVTYIAVVG